MPKAALAFLLLSPLPCFAQPCAAYFKVLQSDPHIQGGTMERLSEPQKKWLTKKEQKKYPSVCYDSAKATYAIVWNQERGSRLISNDKEVDVNGTDGTKIGTTTTSKTSQVQAFLTYVSVMKIESDGKLRNPPLFFDTDHANSNWRAYVKFVPDKSSSADALERAVKFIASLEKP